MGENEHATKLLIEILEKLGFDNPDEIAGMVRWIGDDVDD